MPLTRGHCVAYALLIMILLASFVLMTCAGCDGSACNRTLSASLGASAMSSDFDGKIATAEASFETTMRSCLGTFCFDDAVRTTEGQDVIRVGILSPSKADCERVRSVLITAGLPVGDKLELICTSNVPPYGYGKNHAWSRIIRIARSVVPQSLALLAGEKGSDANSIKNLIDGQIRQLMRWHCRLSHVAAHTAMLTVHTDQLLARPVTEIEKMLTFAGFKPNRENLLAALDTHLSALKTAWDDSAVMREFYHNTTNQSGRNTHMAEAILERAVAAINKEMAETSNLTKWPCKSFRDYRDKGIVDALPLPVKALAADCGAKFVKCSVRYDQDEYKRTFGG